MGIYIGTMQMSQTRTRLLAYFPMEPTTQTQRFTTAASNKRNTTQ